MTGTLHDLVAAELAVPADARVVALAGVIAARFGEAAEAVLFYGSCLRGGALDGAMLDFYVIVTDYGAAYGGGARGRWLARLNRWLPPNVFPFAADGLSAKYAVLHSKDFARLCSSQTDNPAVWARFAQPSRLVWVRDHTARTQAIAAIAGAAPALLGAAAPLLAGDVTVADLWRRAFAETFATELRAEPPGRGAGIVAADPPRYAAFGAALYPVANGSIRLPQAGTPYARRDWARRRRRGKALSAMRLLKAALTYDAGLDYLAWKVERHSGVAVPLKAWHRRWPLLGGLALLPRLLARGAVR